MLSLSSLIKQKIEHTGTHTRSRIDREDVEKDTGTTMQHRNNRSFIFNKEQLIDEERARQHALRDTIILLRTI